MNDLILRTLSEMVGTEIKNIVERKKGETSNTWVFILSGKNGGYYTLVLSDHQGIVHNISIEDFFEDGERDFRFLSKDKDDLDNVLNNLLDGLFSDTKTNLFSPKSNVIFKSGKMLFDFESIEYFGVEEIIRRDDSSYCTTMIGEYSLDRAIATGDLEGSKIMTAELICDNYLLKVGYSDGEFVIYDNHFPPYRVDDYNKLEYSKWEDLLYKFYSAISSNKINIQIQSQSDFINAINDSLTDGLTADEDYLNYLCSRLNIESISVEQLKLVDFKKLVDEMLEDDTQVDDYEIIYFEENTYLIQKLKKI